MLLNSCCNSLQTFGGIPTNVPEVLNSSRVHSRPESVNGARQFADHSVTLFDRNVTLHSLPRCRSNAIRGSLAFCVNPCSAKAFDLGRAKFSTTDIFLFDDPLAYLAKTVLSRTFS